MDKSIIEDKGINAVSEYLSDIGYIKPYLSSNDKTPMWDGWLFVYKSKEGFCNGNFDYRVPVQVKASQFDGDVFPETTSFSVGVSDLRNYLNDGGLVFFKVLINEKRKEVYCSFLTKAVIQDVLSSADGQQTKNIELLKAPEDGRIILENLKRIYLLREHPQLDLSVLKGKKKYKLNFQLEHLSKDTDPLEYLATHAIDILFSYDELPVEFYPKEGPVKLQTIQTENVDISVGSRVYYHSYLRHYKEDGLHILIGNSVDIRIPYNRGEHFNINFNIKLEADSLDSVIHELEFIQALRKYGQFNYGSSHFTITISDGSCEVFNEWEKSLRFWSDVKNVLQILHVEPSFNPKTITDKDEKELNTLIQSFVYNKSVYSDSKEDMIHIFQIADMKIVVFAKHLTGREFKLMEIYDQLSAVFIDEKGSHRHVPVLSAIFEMDELPANLYLKDIVKTYKWYQQYNNQISLRANQDLLNMLNHYDQCHDERVLLAAVEIATWLKNEKKSAIGDRNILLLNYMQTIKRLKQSLNIQEREKLLKMKSSDNTQNFARFLLLDDMDKAEKYLARIPENELCFLKTLPIYHFMNEK